MFKPILTALGSCASKDVDAVRTILAVLKKDIPDFGGITRTYRAETCYFVPFLFLVIAKYYGMIEKEINNITDAEAKEEAEFFIHDLWIISALGCFIDANIAENNQIMKEEKNDDEEEDENPKSQSFA